jgi:aminoglycoside phosphotransferase (APT) family kinase protein
MDSVGSGVALSSCKPIEGSRRLGTLQPEQFQRALSRFGFGDFVSAQPIPHGLFGQNVFVTSTKGRYVLRGCPHWEVQFQKERFFCEEICKQTGVPVPYPYLIDESKDIFGWQYVLMPRMPGKFIHDPEIIKTLTLDDRIEIAKAMGQTLAELHNCRFAYYGDWEPDINAIKPQDRTFSQWVLYQLGRTLDSCARLPDFNPPADMDWMRQEIETLIPATNVPFQPCAVQHDFKEGNANHDRIDGRWRVTGLFDLLEFFSGDGEMDLSRQAADYIDLDMKAANAFVQSYLAGRPPRERFAERFRLYMICDRLTIWDYGIHHGWFKPGQTLRAWLEPILNVEI